MTWRLLAMKLRAKDQRCSWPPLGSPEDTRSNPSHRVPFPATGPSPQTTGCDPLICCGYPHSSRNIQNLWWIQHAAWFSQAKLRIPHSRHWQTPARPSILKRISATKTPVPLFRVPCGAPKPWCARKLRKKLRISESVFGILGSDF